MTLFDSLAKEKKTVAFPKKSFDPGSGSSAEKEKSIRNEQVDFVFSFDDRSQGVDPVTHVGVTTDDIDGGKVVKVGILKHGAPP